MIYFWRAFKLTEAGKMPSPLPRLNLNNLLIKSSQPLKFMRPPLILISPNKEDEVPGLQIPIIDDEEVSLAAAVAAFEDTKKGKRKDMAIKCLEPPSTMTSSSIDDDIPLARRTK